MEVIGRVQMLMLNDSEARQLAEEHNLVKAARKISAWGPKYVVIKKGEHGAILFAPSGPFALPACPLEHVCDPTGAGDTFAGGLMGALARGGRISDSTLRKATVYGTVVASFGVESFSLDRLARISPRDITGRFVEFTRMTRI